MIKKRLLFVLALAAGPFFGFAQSVAINDDGSSPDPRAMLDIKSNSKGLLLPRMSSQERNAIPSPPGGLIVYDTDMNRFYYFGNGGWIEIGSGGTSNYWSLNGTHIFKNNAGNVGMGTNAPTSARLHISGGLDYGNTQHGLRISGNNSFLDFADNSGVNCGFLRNRQNNTTGGFDLGLEIGVTPPPSGQPDRSISFSTHYSPRVIIKSNGNVGIGTTTSSTAKLHVFGGIDYGNTEHSMRLSGNNVFLDFADTNGINYGFFRNRNNNTTGGFDVGLEIGVTPPLSGQPERSISFSTHYGTRMIIKGNGNVGIGTTMPAARFQIDHSGESIRLSGGQTAITFYSGADYKGYIWHKNTHDLEIGTGEPNTNGKIDLSIRGTPYLSVKNNGQVSINGNPATFWTPALTVQGRFSFWNGANQWTFMHTGFGWEVGLNCCTKAYMDSDGDWNTFSDIRLKEDIEPYKEVLPGVRKLQIATYHLKDNRDGKISFGLIAQNVAQYFPEIAREWKSEDGREAISLVYSKTGVIALKAIQEQQELIESLQKQVDELAKKFQELRKCQ